MSESCSGTCPSSTLAADVENRLMAFQDLYNLAARPFNWKYTKKDLNALLARIAAHEPDAFTATAGVEPVSAAETRW